MLTDMQLKALKPAEKIYKVSDQRGLYVAVTPTGVASFRFDYRLNGRRETLVIGQYDSTLGMRKPGESSAENSSPLPFMIFVDSRAPCSSHSGPTNKRKG